MAILNRRICAGQSAYAIGAYGGAALEATYPNGDRVAYVTAAFECRLPNSPLSFEEEELIETAWFTVDEVQGVSRHEWIDAVLNDAL
ncbi:hypothetical protein ACFOYW_13630 [Gryllotalpicola reticulitermitis]|uniref:NUDIX domain-containing protein n=1 Tax=Gryllotalpicola reticulitermitis TaxID=1184153 RepID=A0ABV8Q9T0_9MICO